MSSSSDSIVFSGLLPFGVAHPPAVNKQVLRSAWAMAHPPCREQAPYPLSYISRSSAHAALVLSLLISYPRATWMAIEAAEPKSLCRRDFLLGFKNLSLPSFAHELLHVTTFLQDKQVLLLA